MQPLFSTAVRSGYHDGMLIVRLRQPGTQMGMSAAMATAATYQPTAGLAALSFYERAGMVKRVVPLAKSRAIAARRPGMSALSAVLTAAEPAEKERPEDRTSIVELEPDQDTQALQVALAGDPNVEAVSKVPVRYLLARAARRKRSTTKRGTSIAAAPPPASTMWNLRAVRWAEARALPGLKEATSIRVAVLDTGIDMDHPDLAGRVAQYVFEHPDIPTASSAQDIIGHGTHVAGTIGASINNTLGINGICHCKLHAWKIFDDEPDYDPFSRAFVYYVDPVMYRRALADCVEAGVEVMNLSIGGPGEPDFQEKLLFEQLIANGTVVCAAMGNERQFGSPTSYPAAIPGVIAVGATSLDDSVTTFSNRGAHISISAPGQAIWSTLPRYPGQTEFEAVIGPDGRPRQGKPLRRETDYDAWPGTSMASPHVAGAAALLLANKGTMSPANARTRFMNAADRVPGMGGQAFHPDYGAGRLNLERLLR